MTRVALAVVGALACLAVLAPASASASLPCKLAGAESGALGKACGLAQSPGKALSAGKDFLTGHFGSAFKDILGGASSTASTKLALVAVVAWVVGGAKFALDETAKILSHTTRPNLRSTWFSGAYWRMAGIAALLTLPFLFAAAVQALMRSDLGLLTQAALGYLPLAMLAVSVAAPVATLLLAATDQLCGLVSSVGAGGGSRMLASAGIVLAAAHGQAFVTFLLAAITAGGALMVWLELAVREAAVYVIVLMLPLAFAALVWPARRLWAIRSVELLVALILSKFAIVAVLGLAGAALGQGSHGGLATALAGAVLVLLAAFAPWALLRLIPLSELAAGAAGALRPELDRALHYGVRQDRAPSDRPPQRTTDDSNRTGAEAEKERLREQEGAAEQRGDERPSAETAANTQERSSAPDAGGRPAVLATVGASERRDGLVGEEPVRDEPVREGPVRPQAAAIVLGPSAFKNGAYDGPVNDLLSGESDEDRNPLPPSPEEDLL
jgi:hypothetical protein